MMNTAKPYQKRSVFITVLMTAVMLIILFTTFALLEFSRSKEDLTTMLDEEGIILLEILRASGERSVLAFEALEDIMQQRLLASSRLIEDIDYTYGLDQDRLKELAQNADLFCIHLLDKSGRRSMSSIEIQTNDHAPDSMLVRAGIVDFIRKGEEDTLIVGLRQGQDQRGVRHAVVLRRRKGGGVVVTADAGRLLELRRELGPGRLIQEIGQRQGMAYVVLQDTLGILLASRGVEEMSRIQNDHFLNDINRQQSHGMRFVRYLGKEVFEIAGCFLIDGENLGLFRIGLETAHYQHILSNVRFRLFFIVFLFVLMGIAGIGFWLARLNARMMTASYHQVKTHTGEILQSMKEAVIAIDELGVITVFNQAAARLFGILQIGAVGKQLLSLGVPALDILNKSLTGQHALDRPMEEVLVGKQKKMLALRTSILEKEGGGIDSVILVATDLTVQVELEAALRQKEKMSAMGKLASGVAHEIRNPINAIGMIAQRFLKEFRPTDDVEEYETLARTMVQETRRSNEIIQRFLRFARPARLNFAPVSMNQLLQDVANVMRSRIEGDGINFSVEVGEDKILLIDRDQMKQALINLLQNALDAMTDHGRIVLLGEPQDSMYKVEVRDSGQGIPKAVLGDIFDLYFTTKADGLGMGLSIVHQIIQRHGGSIDVKSKPEEGTAFFLWLPGEGQ
ncbi:PAS domain-containing protein [bacterium]|nr:PAS domain-containing protein [bacterium]